VYLISTLTGRRLLTFAVAMLILAVADRVSEPRETRSS
jgi:hypothetical protein